MEKVLFWDFDGTLSYPNKSFETALSFAIAKAGYQIDPQSSSDFFKNTYTWKSPMDDHTQETGETWWTVLFAKTDVFCRDAGIPETALPQIHAELKAKLIHIDNYGLYEDTLSTLATCKAMGYHNFLLTNNYPEILENVKKLGIYDYFTDFVVSSHVGYDKPRQELYDYAKKLAGNPEICYMIGDNPQADIAGSKQAGMTAIYVHNGKLDIADHSLDRLSEIPAILR